MLGQGSEVVVFFFQAEDGIRDTSVTGVQTCALPISRKSRRRSAGRSASVSICARGATSVCPGKTRSEERRVGKECRSRWWPEHQKKRKKRQKETETVNRKQSERVASITDTVEVCRTL